MPVQNSRYPTLASWCGLDKGYRNKTLLEESKVATLDRGCTIVINGVMTVLTCFLSRYGQGRMIHVSEFSIMWVYEQLCSWWKNVATRWPNICIAKLPIYVTSSGTCVVLLSQFSWRGRKKMNVSYRYELLKNILRLGTDDGIVRL